MVPIYSNKGETTKNKDKNNNCHKGQKCLAAHSALNEESTPSLETLSFLLFVQVNEAFAPQFIAVQKELELDVDKTNVNGGAIALGHPVGTSGARITGHLVHELRRRGAKYAVGSACIGGGQGIAIVLENVQ